MSIDKKIFEIDDTYDFGFSFADEEEVTAPIVQSEVAAVDQTNKDKMEAIERLILPLLYNLMKNPEKPYIKWENRVPVIERQIEKITNITRS